MADPLGLKSNESVVVYSVVTPLEVVVTVVHEGVLVVKSLSGQVVVYSEVTPLEVVVTVGHEGVLVVAPLVEIVVFA